MRSELSHRYPGIEENGDCSCGGNQMLLENHTLQQFGCGAIAALDLVRYLHLYHSGCRTDLFSGIPDNYALSRTLYALCVQRLCNSYLPILPHIATNGVFLSAGINAYFRHYHLPLQARWGVTQDNLWREIKRMLDADIPVILGIGKPVKHLLGSKGLNLYSNVNGEFEIVRQVSAHFLTVIKQDERWLYVSSWGKEYAIDHRELLRYTAMESAQFLCNILQIFPKF